MSRIAWKAAISGFAFAAAVAAVAGASADGTATPAGTPAAATASPTPAPAGALWPQPTGIQLKSSMTVLNPDGSFMAPELRTMTNMITWDALGGFTGVYEIQRSRRVRHSAEVKVFTQLNVIPASVARHRRRYQQRSKAIGWRMPRAAPETAYSPHRPGSVAKETACSLSARGRRPATS